MTATMTEFVIDPVSCSITYECTSVTRNGTPDNPVSCGDFTFDFDFASSGSAGQITITPTGTDYVDGDIEPGTYTVTITGTAVDSGQTDT